MASRATDKVEGLVKRPTIIAGRFRPNAAGVIDNTLNKGRGFTVARSGVGAYLVTLDDGYPELLSVVPGVQLNTLLKGCVQITGAIASPSPTGFTIQYQEETAGALAAAEIASNANNWVHFVAYLRNSELV